MAIIGLLNSVLKNFCFSLDLKLNKFPLIGKGYLNGARMLVRVQDKCHNRRRGKCSSVCAMPILLPIQVSIFN